MKKPYLFLCAFWLFFSPVIAINDFFLGNLDVKTGLSDNFVKDILRDQYGFMWLATGNGLNRYDGYHFKKYTVSQLGAYNDDVVKVMEDAAGTMWIMSYDSIFVYNRSLDVIESTAKERLQSLGIKDSVGKIYIDDARNLWAISSKSLYYYDFNKETLKIIKIPSRAAIASVTARANQVYVLTVDGNFYHVDINNGVMNYEKHIDIAPSEWLTIYLDSRGGLWFYAAHSPNCGLYRYITYNKQWDYSPILASLQNIILVSLIDDEMGKIWIGTESEGIYLLEDDLTQLDKLTRNATSLSSLPSNHIGCFYKDMQNVMWIGTTKWGATYVDLSPQFFKMTKYEGREDVSCLTQDKQGNIWIGYDGDGMARVSPTGNVTFYNKESSSMPSDIVTCSLSDREGHLWVGTFGAGILSFDGSRFVPYQAGGFSTTFMRCMAEDEKGNLWFGTIDNGLVCQHPDGTFEQLTKNNTEIYTNSITSLHSDRHGNLYVGTSTGFYIYDTKAWKFKSHKSYKDELLNKYVTSICKDSYGLVWIGTTTGLLIYDETHDQLYSLTEKDGLSNAYVRSVLADNNNNVWVSTDKGITLVKAVRTKAGGYSFQCKTFYDEDGLKNAAFYNNATCLTAAGRCLIGCNIGVIDFDGKKLPTEDPETKVVFTELTIGNQQVEVGDETGVLSSNLQMAESITLSYDQNNFSVDVSAMNYKKKHKTIFLYRMSEAGNQWAVLTGNRISFNALEPGNYTLEVKATDRAGWISEPSVLSIRVRPPFWRSIPAYVLYVLLIIAYIFFTVKRLKKKNEKMLAQQKLEMELKQQHQIEAKKMQFFTNISHDLKTPLSLIMSPIEKLLSGQLDESVRVELDLVWRTARQLRDEMAQLLDFRKLDVGSEELHLSHGDFVEFLRKVVDSFRYYAESRNIQIRFLANVDSLEMDFDQGKMRRVVMNLLSNAIKYNVARGSVTVLVGREGQNMQLKISDTGIGIKDENKHRIFDRFFQEGNDSEYVGSGIGLHIVKEYVTMHHGTISVADNQPQGTVFTVSLPMTSNEELKAKSEEVVETEEEKVETFTPATTNRVTILVVEDNRDMRMFLERCLGDQYHVLTAENGKEALKVLAGNDVNIVISDVMMPEMNGLELCNHIKTNVTYSHIPVILLTAKSTEESIISGLKVNADDYITKPFNLSILQLRIQKILEWTANNHRTFGKTIDIQPSEITVSSLDEELITRAIKIVEDHMGEINFSVEDLSTEIGLTRGHLYKKLVAITGKSPLEFIRTLRIKRGKAILEQGRTNISQVAYSVGFSPKQFTKYFKEEYGKLPSEFVR